MLKNKFKRGLTLIELMAVIGIVKILLAITTPMMNGYIGRAKKVNIRTQSRKVVHYSISANSDIESNIKLSKLINSNMLSDHDGKLDFFQDDIELKTLLAISKDKDVLNKIKINNRKIVEWIGENPYKKE